MAEKRENSSRMDKDKGLDLDFFGQPNMITVHRDRKGFGFTLRHFIVYPADMEQALRKSGKKLDGSEAKHPKMMTCEPMDTIFVKQVKEGGPAHSAGLRKGDRIVSVNGQNVTGKSYSQVVALIQASDQSLKLLVVPKDEDALQMAYQCSAYTQGKDAYTGSADDIPEPPGFNKGKPPPGHRYKSELKVVPEDGRLDNQADPTLTSQPYDLDSRVPRQRTSLSSVSSGSTGSGSGHIGSRDSLHRASLNLTESLPASAKFSSATDPPQLTDAPPSSLSKSYHGSIQTARDNSSSRVGNVLNSVGTGPPVQSRTSSRNILLKYPESGGTRNRAGSLDSLSRSSDSSGASRRSHDTGRDTGTHQQQRMSMPIQPKKAFDSVELSTFSSKPPHQLNQYKSDMGNGMQKRSHSRDREYSNKQSYSTNSHGSRENIPNLNNRSREVSGIRSSTDELRRRFFENGSLGSATSTTPANISITGSPITTGNNRYKQPYTRANTTASVSFEPRSTGSPIGVQISIHNNSVPPTSLSQPDVNSSNYHSSSSGFSSRSPSLGAQRLFSPVNLTSTPRYAQQQTQFSTSHHQNLDFKPISSTPGSHNDSYGLTVSLSTVASSDNSRSKGYDESDSLYNNKPQQRLSLQEPNDVNLVTERMKLYESDSNIEAVKSSPVNNNDKGYHRSRSPRFDLMQKGPQPYGSNSVATKAAFYENKDKTRSPGAALWGSGPNSKTSSTSSLQQQAWPSDDMQKNPSTPVSSVPLYFRTESPSVPFEKSPERQHSRPQQPVGSSPHLDVHLAMSHSRDRDRSPMGAGSFQDLQFDLSPSSEPREFRRQKPTRRQPSYLTAIDNAKLSAYLDRLHTNQPLHASIDSVTAADTYDRLADTWPQFQQWSENSQAKSLESLSSSSSKQLSISQPHQQPPITGVYSNLYSGGDYGGFSGRGLRSQYLSPLTAYKSYHGRHQSNSNHTGSNRSVPGRTGSNQNVNNRTGSNQNVNNRTGSYQNVVVDGINEDDGGFGRFTSSTRASSKANENQDGITDPVRLRTNYTSQEERDNKLMRRTSYLMATRQASTGGTPSGEVANQEISSGNQDVVELMQGVELHSGIVQTFKRQERSKLKLTLKGPNHQQTLPVPGSYGVAYPTKPTPMSPIPQSPRTPINSPKLSPQTPTSPSEIHIGSPSASKQPKNIKKLKAFFGERTPKIVEAQKTANDLPPSPVGDVILEGTLSCKLAMTDGKRSTDRSWKPMWALLRGHALFLYKDKASVSPLFFEESPISIKSALVDIAHDYTKKKNVFRLTTYNGSEYLFQADDPKIMNDWITAIQENNNPDKDNKQVCSQELVSRKIQQVAAETVVKSPPAPTTQCQMKVKQKSSRSLRSKSPAAHSPGMKQKKQASKDEYGESPKANKTWKGKMVKKFKRSGSSTNAAISESSEVESQASFCVPIEDCPPSTFSEFVPFAVEVCTKIVEARGLENQGIYRVPGNNGAISMLQAELDKGPDLVDMDNEKWLDVNVVSSLLKSFFRKLPDPLITEELYHGIIHANRIENQEKRMLRLKKILHDLPEHNFETFQYLAEHLARVIDKEELNKMDARNIAIVFGPTLIRTAEESMVNMVKDMSDQCRIIESIVSHPQWFFGSWDEDVYVPCDKHSEGIAPISGMNQQLINKAENMQLGERGKEFSAKDLVSSVFSAANKKVRRRDKTKGDSIDGDMESESGYNERNIDAEIEIRGKQNAQEAVAAANALSLQSNNTSQMTVSSSKIETKSITKATVESSSSSAKLQTAGSKSASRIETISNSERPQVAVSSSMANVTKSMQMNADSDQQSKSSSTSSVHQQQQQQSKHQASSQQGLYSAKMEFFQQPPQPVSLQPHFTLGPAVTARKGSLDGEREDLQVKRYPAYPAPDLHSFSTETYKPTIHYKYRAGHRGITPPPGGAVSQSVTRGRSPGSSTTATTSSSSLSSQSSKSQPLKPHTQQNLKRMEFETQALMIKQKEEVRQKEKEERELAKQRIEMELQKTKQELEQEDEFDLYPKSFSASAAAASSSQQQLGYGNLDHNHYQHYHGLSSAQHNKIDLLADFTSDYSTNSSNTNTLDSKASLPVPGYTSDYSSSASPSIVQMQQKQQRRNISPQPLTGWSGKYFVLSSQSSPRLDKRKSRDDIELYRHPSPREKAAGAFDFASKMSSHQYHDIAGEGGNYLTVKDPRVRRPSGNNNQRKESLSRHGGSLDSLIDQYETLNYSYCESDSEQEHEDLVQSLTATFDLKMKSLIESPPPVAKGLPAALSTSSSSSSAKGPGHGQIILAQGDQQHFVPSSFVDRFRDPSLHRVTPPKGDPKIGIACRFERKDIDSQFGKRGDQFSSSNLYGWAAQPLGQSYLAQGNNDEKSSKSPSVAKSEKTDTNLSIKCNRTPHAKVYAQAVRKSGEKLYGSRENLLILGTSSQDDNNDGVVVAMRNHPSSPQPSSGGSSSHHRRKNPRERRRHTVGGTHDTEHMSALLAASAANAGGNRPERLSAWERLQPGKHRNSEDHHQPQEQPPKDMQSWLSQQQRLRAVKSTPSLIDPNLTYGGGNSSGYSHYYQGQHGATTNNATTNFGFYEYDQFSPSENRRIRRLNSHQKSAESSSGGSASPALSSYSAATAGSNISGGGASSVVHNVYQDTQLRTKPGEFTFESTI